VKAIGSPLLSTKKIVEVKDVDTVREMEMEKCEYETDGLIFTHKEQPIIYKWKPKDMITIDLFCARVGTQAIACAAKYKNQTQILFDTFLKKYGIDQDSYREIYHCLFQPPFNPAIFKLVDVPPDVKNCVCEFTVKDG
jgi:hypothetical protein